MILVVLCTVLSWKKKNINLNQFFILFSSPSFHSGSKERSSTYFAESKSGKVITVGKPIAGWFGDGEFDLTVILP